MNAMVDAAELKPVVPFLVVRDKDGNPGLQGSRCSACNETVVGTVKVCPNCGGRNSNVPVSLSTRGHLYNYTIVHRSLPGVKVPFISAIVALDGGGAIKGTLAVPIEDVAYDMLVEVSFLKADQVDTQGREYLIYQFVQA